MTPEASGTAPPRTWAFRLLAGELERANRAIRFVASVEGLCDAFDQTPPLVDFDPLLGFSASTAAYDGASDPSSPRSRPTPAHAGRVTRSVQLTPFKPSAAARGQDAETPAAGRGPAVRGYPPTATESPAHDGHVVPATGRAEARHLSAVPSGAKPSAAPAVQAVPRSEVAAVKGGSASAELTRQTPSGASSRPARNDRDRTVAAHTQGPAKRASVPGLAAPGELISSPPTAFGVETSNVVPVARA